MSVKKEPSGRRSIQVEVEVPGTPEQVWRAISSGPGISSWFVPTKLEERQGGKMEMNFGPGADAIATITSWEPPVRFSAESRHLGENAPAMATEWFVEAREGGVCVVRVVHSLFAETDDWDGELEGTESGWPVYFRVLRLYLSKFSGMTGTSMVAVGSSTDSESQTWNKLCGQLGLSDRREGQTCATGSDAPQFSGVVEWNGEQNSPPSLMLSLAAPAPGIALFNASTCGGGVIVSLSSYMYGENAADAVAKQQNAWQTWLNQHFPIRVPDATE